jgi:HSP20 family protein
MELSLSPWREEKQLARFRREMDRLFDRLFEGWPFRIPGQEGEWAPSVDISETGKELIVKAEVPGLDPKDVDVSLEGNILTLRGERRKEEEETGENFHRIEQRHGSFFRSIRLPAEVDVNKVKAQYKNGILKINLPKIKEAAVKKIEIKSA